MSQPSPSHPRPGPARAFPGAEVLSGRSIAVEHHLGPPNVAYHFHQLFELVVFRGGMGSRLVGDSFQDVGGPDLILLGPALPHGWSVTGGPPSGPAELEFVVVLFTRESLGLEILSKPEFSAVRDLVDRAGRGLSWPEEAIHRVEGRLFQLPHQADTTQYLSLLGVLDELARSSPSELVSPAYRAQDEQREHEDLARVLEVIHRRHAEPIALADVAGAVHMSVPTFTRFFRRMTGTSFVDYLNEWRVRRACSLLAETDLRVADIADACGFANLSHFNRQFRRRRSATPTDWRGEHRADAPGQP